MLELNKIYCGDNIELIKQLDDCSIDLTVTSPPYDNLRTYNGYTFQFEPLAKELYRVTKQGGIVVWVVGDATINGSETGTSFRQALYFKEVGFNLNDTMIYHKSGFPTDKKYRYYQRFEYMFVISKGKPKTFNPLLEKTKTGGKPHHSCDSTKSGYVYTGVITIRQEYGIKGNVWYYPVGGVKEVKHPAQFPKALAREHILSWSNIEDTVLDPFMGSGTTAVVCKEMDRNFIGMDISQEYCDIANKRLQSIQKVLL